MKGVCAVLALLLASQCAFAAKSAPSVDVDAVGAAVKNALTSLVGQPGETQPAAVADSLPKIGSTSYESTGGLLEDLKNEIKDKFAPAPTPAPLPAPTPDAITVPAYAGSPTDIYNIPGTVATYNKSSFIPIVPVPSPDNYKWDTPTGADAKLLAAYVPPYKPDDYSTTKYPPMQCSGNAYCFQNCFTRNITTPACPPGYSFDAYKDICSKTVGYKCPDYALGNLAIVDIPAPCYICEDGYSFNKDSGLCEETCLDGYEAVTIGTNKFCVQQCPKNFWVYGSICLSSQCYNPAACAADVCLPGFTFYWTGAASGGSNGAGYPGTASEYNGKKATGLASITTTAVQPVPTTLLDLLKAKKAEAGVDTNCNCCYSLNRDNYARKCKKPTVIQSKAQKVTCPRLCPPGSTLELDGLCHYPCPAGCQVDDQKCCFTCPPGMVECSYHGRKFCATSQGLCGIKLDSCTLLSKFADRLDTNVVCPAGNFFSPVVFTGAPKAAAPKAAPAKA